MPLPNPDERCGDALRNIARPVPRPFRVATPLPQYRKGPPKTPHELIDDMAMDLQKFPFALRIGLMIGGAGALWLGIFHLTQMLLK